MDRFTAWLREAKAVPVLSRAGMATGKERVSPWLNLLQCDRLPITQPDSCRGRQSLGCPEKDLLLLKKRD